MDREGRDEAEEHTPVGSIDDPVTLFVNGTLMRGLELHANLTGAEFLGAFRTAPRYRLYSIGDRHPGMFEVPAGGVAVEGELYRLPPDVWHRVHAGEPPGLYRGPVTLADDRTVDGILFPRELAEGCHREISQYGGWREYVADRGATHLGEADPDAIDMTIDSPTTLPAWALPWPALALDWSRAALMVIDVQNYGANPQVGLLEMLGREQPAIASYVTDRIERVMLPNIGRLIDAFHAGGREVVYTRHGALLPDGRDLIARRRQRNTDAEDQTGRTALWSRGTFEHEIVRGLEPRADDLVVDKNSSSPFNGTGIDQLLRNLGVTTLVLTGTATDMCVETTARDAADRGYDVVVVEDATATYYPRHHVAALSAIARVYGQVWTSHEVLDAVAAAPPRPV